MRRSEQALYRIIAGYVGCEKQNVQGTGKKPYGGVDPDMFSIWDADFYADYHFCMLRSVVA